MGICRIVIIKYDQLIKIPFDEFETHRLIFLPRLSLPFPSLLSRAPPHTVEMEDGGRSSGHATFLMEGDRAGMLLSLSTTSTLTSGFPSSLKKLLYNVRNLSSKVTVLAS